MYVHITDLKPADQVQGWMRLGLPLMLAANADGTEFRMVPWRPTSPRPCDLTKFLGLVISNHPDTKVIHLSVTSTDHRGQTNSGESLPAHIPYVAIQILRLLSPAHFPARQHNSIHPTNVQSQYVPYRTTVNVHLR